jgi:selenocysteine lyase/cysteine desulfurase
VGKNTSTVYFWGMSNRRSFIRNNALLFTALATGQHLDALEHAPNLLSGDPSDESYWRMVRAQFPLDSKKTFLNNGTMGPSPYPVLEAVNSGLDKTSREAQYGGGEAEALEALAGFLGTGKEELALVHNVSEAINIVAHGLPFSKGDEVLITGHEHVGNALPWLNRARLDGIVLKVVPLGTTADETLNNVNAAITRKTKALALPHIPCTIGQVLPVKDICALAAAKGLWSFIDGAHPPGMLELNLHDIGCDFYASCCHKWMLGPQGTGFLYVKKDKLDLLQTRGVGGGSDTGWDMLSQPPSMKGYAASAHRYYYGTQSAALYHGIVAAIAFQNNIGRANIEQRVRSLAAYLQEQLLALGNGIEMLTPVEAASRGAQIAFRFRGKDNRQFYEQLAKKNIVIRHVPENGLDCLRVSTHMYNFRDEANLLAEEVKRYIG